MDTRELLQGGFRYAMSLTHDRQQAEDLLQEAWARVLAANGPRHKGYLYATLRNVFHDGVAGGGGGRGVGGEGEEGAEGGEGDEGAHGVRCIKAARQMHVAA